jgi:hypothetical protein
MSLWQIDNPMWAIKIEEMENQRCHLFFFIGGSDFGAGSRASSAPRSGFVQFQ